MDRSSMHSENHQPTVTADMPPSRGRAADDAIITAAPIKRRRRNAVPNDSGNADLTEERGLKVRRVLFPNTNDDDDDDDDDNDFDNDIPSHVLPSSSECPEVEKLKKDPTLNRFVYERDIIDLGHPLPAPHQEASIIMTSIFNTFMHINRYKSSLSSLKNRKLSIQLRTDEHRLRKLEESNYKDAHIILPRMVETMFTMLDHRNSATVYINQLTPISCLVGKEVMKESFSYRSMEATTKNNSDYIELVFSNPFRFIFIGSSRRNSGKNNVNEVSLFPFFGQYLDKTLNDMYEVLYDLVSKEIEKAKKEMEGLETVELESNTVHQVNSLQGMESYSNTRNAQRNAAADTARLHQFLRLIDLPLARKDNYEILVTSGNSGKSTSEASKMSYLAVEDNKGRYSLKMMDSDEVEQSIFLSSYIRCRVLLNDRAKFGLQIYTRLGIKLMSIDDRLVKFSELFDETEPI